VVSRSTLYRQLRPMASAGVVTRHVFADETKRQGYVVAAAAVPPGDLAPLRSVVRGLGCRAAARAHERRAGLPAREVAVALVDARVAVVIYDAGRRYSTQRRAARSQQEKARRHSAVVCPGPMSGSG